MPPNITADKSIPMSIPAFPPPRKPLLLAASLALAGVAAFSIHVGMLAAGVPFPLAQPPTWARWLSNALVASALLVLLRLAHPRVGHMGVLARTLIIACILMAIQETLRARIMTGVVTTAWMASALSLVRPVASALLLSLLSVIAVRWVRSAASLAIAALVVGAAYVALQLLLGLVLSPLTELVASLGRPEAYAFPYPFHVTFLAYLTFAEPVMGTAALLMLAWDRLPASRPARLAVLALMVALVKGVVGMTFLYSFFMTQPPLPGMLSWSQFLFEFLALGALAGAAWKAFGPPGARAPATPSNAWPQ
ncbi:hypothetical protein [Stenotrophomonas tumulicola]|uniref:Uncharacterized protein n=1 Tax=Stenotrophomonas tumulicola TaxID=1685415 RepID=A0A7W3FN57_9GAMM|nr:hypothetical protein [Stenotrophomonas tumulicola]MBA8682622.1 hypothetical protein [Stenotrophomonas tumulicola]